METLSGRVLGIPCIGHLSAICSHSAKHIGWHAHRGIEVLFLLQGATAYEYRRGGGVDLAGGHLLVVPPGTVHRGRHAVRMPSTLCGILCQPWNRAGWRGGACTPAEWRRIHDLLAAHAGGVRGFGRRLRAVLERLMAEMAAPATDPFRLPALRSLVGEALVETARVLERPEAENPEALVAAAQAWLTAHAAEPVRMADLVKHIGLGRSRLFALFKARTGLGPNDWLQRHRVERASLLLADTPRSITDIALATGFSSSQYFSAVFRRYLGTTAVAWRRAVRSRPGEHPARSMGR